MTRIAAYHQLQDRFGKEQAQALAEYIESQEGPDLSRFATKDDIAEVRQEMTEMELRLVKEIAKVREDLGRTREDMISRMNWTTIIQVLTTIGALVALSKVI